MLLIGGPPDKRAVLYPVSQSGVPWLVQITSGQPLPVRLISAWCLEAGGLQYLLRVEVEEELTRIRSMGQTIPDDDALAGRINLQAQHPLVFTRLSLQGQQVGADLSHRGRG